jgi:hypothetical protein
MTDLAVGRVDELALALLARVLRDVVIGHAVAVTVVMQIPLTDICARGRLHFLDLT